MRVQPGIAMSKSVKQRFRRPSGQHHAIADCSSVYQRLSISLRRCSTWFLKAPATTWRTPGGTVLRQTRSPDRKEFLAQSDPFLRRMRRVLEKGRPVGRAIVYRLAQRGTVSGHLQAKYSHQRSPSECNLTRAATVRTRHALCHRHSTRPHAVSLAESWLSR